MQKEWLPVSPLWQFFSSADVWRRPIMDRDIMAEQAIMEALEPVPDIGRHFTARKEFLVGIDTSVIDLYIADIDTLIGGIFVVDTDGTLDVDICAAGIGMLAADTVVEADTSAMERREVAIEAAIAADERCWKCFYHVCVRKSLAR